MLMTFRFPANGCFSQPPTAEEPVTGSEDKRAIYRESLWRTVSDQILPAQCMYALQSQQFVSAMAFMFVA